VITDLLSERRFKELREVLSDANGLNTARNRDVDHRGRTLRENAFRKHGRSVLC
jgi:hypothetical protein